jgi:hypothetical protein
MPVLPYIDFTPSGASGNQYHVNTFTLTPTDISNKYVTLTSVPTDVDKTALNVIGGDMQEYAVDFTVTGNQLSWSSLGLDGVLVSGDVLLVQFN